ncbi:MAG TPA: 50S ribosomal protein L4 [Dehalococcoidia bacterium]|nr:50S ribosomal protein L4 [Dehalococcoidia bacterium]
MKLAVHNIKGEEVRTIDADDSVFGLPPHHAAMRQALLAQLANRRAGSANTKTRGEVAGSTRKIRRQKGTGASRQGAIRAPHHRHGGIVFGPKPRKYRQALPKMVRRLAIRSAISAHVEAGTLKVIDTLGFDAPRTKSIVELMAAFGMPRSALLVTEGANRPLHLSARNVEGAKVLPADYLNVDDLLKHRGVIMSVEAVRRAEALWGGERATKRLAPVGGRADG